jgi:small subunit ribosomal protein S4
MHGKLRTKFSDYRMQLREKQKVKRLYGVFERQFRRYFELAERMKGVTGENLLQILERRVDNIVYRAGWARSRKEARQLVRHRHLLVNGKILDVPGALLKVGDIVEVAPSSRSIPGILEAIELHEGMRTPAGWLEVDNKALQVRIVRLPERQDITLPINEHLIVELYSK